MIAIVGIMAAGLVMALNPMAQIQKANDAKRKNTLDQLRTALEEYYNDNNAYPITTRYYSSEPGGDGHSPNGDGDNGEWIPGLAPTYIPSLPRDPEGGVSGIEGCASGGYKKSYLYYSPDGQNYALLSHCSMTPGTWDDKFAFYDKVRPTWAWKVCAGTGCEF